MVNDDKPEGLEETLENLQKLTEDLDEMANKIDNVENIGANFDYIEKSISQHKNNMPVAKEEKMDTTPPPVDGETCMHGNSWHSNWSDCDDLDDVAAYIGELNIEYQSLTNENQTQSGVSLGSHFIVGGQIKGQEPNLMLVYPEGNHIHMSDDQPYMQIGETMYGKPILDRMIHPDTSIGDAARVALLSLDSTMRSDLTVGPPIDLIVFKKDQINLDFQEQLKLDSPFFKELSDIWAEQIDKGVKKLPKFNWE